MEQGFSEAIEKTSHILSSVKHVEEESLMKEFMSHIERDTGLYCYGVDQVISKNFCFYLENKFLMVINMCTFD